MISTAARIVNAVSIAQPSADEDLQAAHDSLLQIVNTTVALRMEHGVGT